MNDTFGCYTQPTIKPKPYSACGVAAPSIKNIPSPTTLPQQDSTCNLASPPLARPTASHSCLHFTQSPNQMRIEAKAPTVCRGVAQRVGSQSVQASSMLGKLKHLSQKPVKIYKYIVRRRHFLYDTLPVSHEPITCTQNLTIRLNKGAN